MTQQHNQQPRYRFDSIPELKLQLIDELLRDAPPSLELVSERGGGAIALVALMVMAALIGLIAWALLYVF